MHWKGWDESKVRPQRQAAPQSTIHQTTATMGFTAINSSSPAPAPILRSTDSLAAECTGAQDKQMTIASAYLGRGDQEAPVAASSDPAPRKAATKGKKRAVMVTDTRKSKRRKTSNVSDAMPATKPRAKPRKQPTTNVKTKDEEGTLQHEHCPILANDTIRGSQRPMQNTAAENESTSASSLVSVIAPPTSMSAMQTTLQQTSFDAAKSSIVHGLSLYNSSSSPTKQQGYPRFPRPLLYQARQSPAKIMDDRFCEDDTAHASRLDNCSFADEEDDFASLFDELAQQLEGAGQYSTQSNPKTRRKTRSQTKVCRQASPQAELSASKDDDLMDDDNELAEAMVLAEKAMKASSSSKQKAAAVEQPTQLPTPANSDAFTSFTVADTTPPRPKSMRAKASVQKLPLTPEAPKEPWDATASTGIQSSFSATQKHEDYAAMIASDDEDENMIELDKAIGEAEKMGLNKRLHKQSIRYVDQHEDYGGALLDDAEKQLLEGLRCAKVSSDPKPIARSSFPNPILDRSPIFGASNTTVLRTCFRLGEALNVGSQAVRMNKNMILEIYGRVISSFRDGRKQHFILKDLYHDKPPHLEGEYQLWSQSRLWDLDGKAFLKAEESAVGVMCRVVARMKRDGTKWRLEVLSIWEAGWDDVEAVAGIYVTAVGMDINED